MSRQTFPDIRQDRKPNDDYRLEQEGEQKFLTIPNSVDVFRFLLLHLKGFAILGKITDFLENSWFSSGSQQSVSEFKSHRPDQRLQEAKKELSYKRRKSAKRSIQPADFAGHSVVYSENARYRMKRKFSKGTNIMMTSQPVFPRA